MGDAEDTQNETIESLRLQLDGLERGLDMWEEDLRRLSARMDAVEATRP